MRSLLFTDDDDIFFSDLLDDSTISVTITDHGEQPNSVYRKVKLDVEDMKMLVEWLNKQIIKADYINA